MINTPSDLESYVQYVYSTLLNLKDDGVVVSRRAIMFGRSGVQHEIDVFYQFTRAGVTHKVAFECKFTSRPTEKADVMEFHSKIVDIGNVQAVFVSKAGYQRGAIEYAKHYDIKLLKLDDLPTLNVLLANRITAIALPSADCIGEPFWVLMEVAKGELTGTYYAMPGKPNGKSKVIPLFFSKKDARELLQSLGNKDQFVVRGVPQHMLRFMIGIGKQHIMFCLMYCPAENGVWTGVLISPEALEDRYYNGGCI